MAKTDKILTLRNGYWSKRIRPRGCSEFETFYFGKDYDEAVIRYHRERPFLQANLPLPGEDDEVFATVGDLCDEFMEFQNQRFQVGQLNWRTQEQYQRICDKIRKSLGDDTPLIALKVKDFQNLRSDLEVGMQGQQISPFQANANFNNARAVFNFATRDNRLIDRNFPMQSALEMINKKTRRQYRSEQPDRILTAEEIRLTLSDAKIRTKAMIMLGINGAYNNSDVANLKMSMLPIPDMLTYHRRKTYFERVTPIWDETKEAIEQYLEIRGNHPSPYLFVSEKGFDYNRRSMRGSITELFRKQLVKHEIYQEGKNFGALRTTFANLGTHVGDDLAVKALMGHNDGSTLYENYASANYGPRLKKVTDYVHDWLFPTENPE